jgi:hypothetical protein
MGKRLDQTIENNKLFAEFLGMGLQDYHGDLAVFEPMDRIYTKVRDLGFDRDWNKLMRVVKVIEGMEDEYGATLKFPIERRSASILDSLDLILAESVDAKSKFQAVHDTALEFIKSRKDAQKDR